ncbi:acyl-ACP desaturase [Streptomyces canus]|uniref:acyl-ACP desaturase n=1 Tax=Streptomyces canus TaxID=58343 RepID=UPI0037F77F7F
MSGAPVCEGLLTRVAHDENLHMLFYRDLLEALFDPAPDVAMRAVAAVVTSFRMPGHGIEGFARKSARRELRWPGSTIPVCTTTTCSCPLCAG